MKYIKRGNIEYKAPYLINLLDDRKIIDKSDNEMMKKYFNPKIDNLLPPDLLDNMKEGVELLYKHCNSGNRIYLVIDPDVDGFTSSALIYNFLQFYIDKYNFTLDYHIPEGKAHGLSTIMDIFENDKICDLIILPDSSSNDYEQHKILKEMGYDILVLDHHEAERYSEDAVVINNQLSDNYPNKSLSGVGVVFKFIEAFGEYEYNQHERGEEDFMEPFWLDMLDLVALGQISDMMCMGTLENRYICEKGLANIYNGFFKELVEKQSYSLGGTDNITQMGVAWYITPLINALIRVGNNIEKERLFEAFINPTKEVPSTKRGEKGMNETVATQSVRNCINARVKQNKIKEQALEALKVQIINNNLDENKILILNADGLDIPNTLTGLCAMNVAAEYKKPVILGRTSPDGYLKGSMRGREESELKDFKEFLDSSNYLEYVEGHPNAAGASLHISKIDKLTKYANEKLKDIEFNEGCYEVDFILDDTTKSELSDIIFALNEGKHLWGQGNDEAMVLIKNVCLNNYKAIGSNNDTLRFSDDDVTYIQFKSRDLINRLNRARAMNGSIYANIVGTVNINTWGGKTEPQISIKDIELLNVDEDAPLDTFGDFIKKEENNDIWANF